MKFFVSALLLISAQLAFAFPELVRHSYTSCTACHVSSNGGGLLNSYGRELSREVLSFAGWEGEGEFLYGVTKLPEWLSLGGDYRGLQVVQSTDTSERALFFNMQIDFEAAVQFGSFTFFASIGKDTAQSADSTLLSRKHFAAFRINDYWVARMGKFLYEFGIYTPNHRRSTRFNYGFDQNQETYNAEVSFTDEKFGFFVTAVAGRPDLDDSLDLSDTKGLVASGYYALYDDSRIGASARFLNVKGNSVFSLAASTIFTFTHQFFLTAEGVYQSNSVDDKTNSLAEYVRMNWEAAKGLNIYAVQELFRSDLNDDNEDTVGFGGGIQFFPRPHWEILAEYQKRRTPQSVSFSDNLFTLLLHFYL